MKIEYKKRNVKRPVYKKTVKKVAKPKGRLMGNPTKILPFLIVTEHFLSVSLVEQR
jgi:hypothetical protein